MSHTGWAKIRYTLIILCTAIYCIPTFGPSCIKIQFVPHRKPRFFSITKAKRLNSAQGKNIGWSYEIMWKAQINTFCGKIQICSVLRHGIYSNHWALKVSSSNELT